MSSPVARSSANPPTASNARRRTARLALSPAGRKGSCRMDAGTGGGGGVPVQGPEVEHAGHRVRGPKTPEAGGQPPRSDGVVGVAEGQEWPPGRPDPGVAGGRGPRDGRSVDPAEAWVPFGPGRQGGHAPVVGPVVGHDDLPRPVTLLRGQRPQLVLEPGHAVADRDDHADGGLAAPRVGTVRRVRVDVDCGNALVAHSAASPTGRRPDPVPAVRGCGRRRAQPSAVGSR